MYRILISGSTGFLGSKLLVHFARLGCEVIGGKRSSSDLSRLGEYRNNVKFINLDDPAALKRFFENKKIDCVIHAACSYGREPGSEFDVFDSNLTLPIRLANLAKKNKNCLFLNTDTFFSKPEYDLGYMGAYVLSKRHCWEWLKIFIKDLKVINVRLEHVYGPLDDRAKFVSWVCDQFMSHDNKKDAMVLSSCSQLRDFVYIDDVVSAFDTLLKSRSSLFSGQVFEVGTGAQTTVREMVECIEEAFIRSGKDVAQPIFDSSRNRTGEIQSSVADTTELEKLGWQPNFSLAEGVNSLVRAEINGK
ncbi:NAD-dependent epimerase/dehydratase family protein [Halomonas sp. LBP4]|uniref:NAD-dependent epimerase/dehydratase family protein n=1 Tax=Halomonas sp. LBP4 TaxID=2044917 RepID=UPI000D762144|nr:NAD(P)-dependent oxidoreductase [Halomonas sp. LBP4]PXX97665.1 hypothetical protein CR157_13305 [Halomonas sp. LBP4]